MRLCTGATALAALAALAACQPRAAPPAAVVGVTDPAEVACVAAVQAETGTAGASVRSSQVTAAGTSVMVSVPGSEAPWSCSASRDGGVAEVRYAGSGGAL
jgi:hypothetical protein